LLLGSSQANASMPLVDQLSQLTVGHNLVPTVNFLEPKDTRLLEVILSRFRHITRERLEPYLARVFCGILCIAGFAGSGKTETLGLVTLCCLNNPKFDKIVVVAPSHGAVSNICQRINSLNIGSITELRRRYPGHSLSRAVIIRGFNIRTEYSQVVSAVTGKVDRLVPEHSEWKMPLSLCEWTLKLVHYGDFSLAPLDPESLRELQDEYETHEYYEPLRRLFGGKSTWRDIMKEWADGGEIEQRKPSTLLRMLMKCILSRADVLATTPHATRDGDYWKFCRDIAKVTIVDEAGATTIPQALLAWPTFRPLILAGDPRQLSPCVMTLHQKSGGNFVNIFAPHLAVSMLGRVKDTRWPVFTLNEQLRIVNGGFDLASQVFYPDVLDLSYSERCNVTAHPRANAAEKWITRRFPNLKQQEGKILPAFINIRGACDKDRHGSRVNNEQADYAVRLIRDAVRDQVAQAKDICVISPYNAMNTRVRQLLLQYPALADVIVNTTDSFQGQERSIVVFVLTVTAESGPGHTGSPSRLNVGATRHTDALWVIGDIDCDTRAVEAGAVVVMEDGGYETAVHGRLGEFLDWFRREGRTSSRVDVARPGHGGRGRGGWRGGRGGHGGHGGHGAGAGPGHGGRGRGGGGG
jgi:uncharacterized membrane protein YgcG